MRKYTTVEVGGSQRTKIGGIYYCAEIGGICTIGVGRMDAPDYYVSFCLFCKLITMVVAVVVAQVVAAVSMSDGDG